MVKYDSSKRIWIDTEDPDWNYTQRDGEQRFSEKHVLVETFETQKDFYKWLNGRTLRHTTIGLIYSKGVSEDGIEYNAFWQISLHPVITTEEFQWGVRIADRFLFWYDAFKFAQSVDWYMDDVIEELREQWREESTEPLPQNEPQAM